MISILDIKSEDSENHPDNKNIILGTASIDGSIKIIKSK